MEADRKRSYDKPELRTIELVAEEMLTVGCKTYPGDPTGVGPTGHCTHGLCVLSTGS